ncbi:FAD-binding oxidoreductase [Rubellicoccus peritrichatus]|uniref:FAD-binding protein n=1 Tax=Rubellicoccus peritrichatus TaxID=3080537 RepID=A0AAQ3LAP3_9BACT|nr:FAD-binding protein [Puniceicoccus sp. CR14]WOO40732.1 FAD-binding protein [Puniceicoccus sp. CR14]
MNPKYLDQLEKLLPQRVGLIESRIWEAGRQVFSPMGRIRKPAVVVRPANREEVSSVMRWATETNTRVIARSGGHSFDAFCVQDNTVMLDLRDLNQATFEGDRMLKLMPTSTNASVNEVLSHVNYVLPGGDCPTVAMGGQAAGGGFGYLSRLFGLTLDSMVDTTVVTGDGQIVMASQAENSDLFWACRGGGGCAGIMTDMTFDLCPVKHVTCIKLDFQWEAAADILILFTEMMREGPIEMGLKLKIRTTGPGRFYDKSCKNSGYGGMPLVHLDGLFIGCEVAALEYLKPFLNHPSLIDSIVVEKDTYRDAMSQLVPFDLLHDPAPRNIHPIRVASDFSKGGINEDEAVAIVQFIDQLEYAPDLAGGCVLLESCNGAITDASISDTAYPHRNAELLIQWEMFHDVAVKPELIQRHDALLTGVRSELSRILTGGRYVNYADRLDTPRNWWGGNLERLQAITTKYDPNKQLISRMWPVECSEE